MKNDRHASIDYFKFIFAILIIGLHTSVLRDISFEASFVINQIIARLGVPFFFISTSFLLNEKNNNNNNFVLKKRHVIKYIKLFVIFSIIYSPITFLWNYDYNLAIVINIIKYFQLIIFMAPAYLWYISSLIVGLILLRLISRIKIVYSFTLVVFIYIIGVFGNSYIHYFNSPFFDRFYYSIFLTTRNGLFFALPFLYLGYVISKYKLVQDMKTSIIGFIFFFIVFCFEVFFIKSNIDSTLDTSMYILLFPLSYFLFSMVLNLRFVSSNLSIKCSHLSSYMYLLQFGFIAVLILMNNNILTTYSQISETPSFLITIFGTIILALIIEKYIGKRAKKL